MESTINIVKWFINFTSIVCIILVVIPNPTSCQTCAKVPDSSYNVDNLISCYWYFQSYQINGCVGHKNMKSNCTITMAFCRKLQADTGCTDSSLCVKTTNGTGQNLTVSHSVGLFEINKSPFTVSSTGDGFVARFRNGSDYKRGDNSTCKLQSEVQFKCNTHMKWTPASTGESSLLPINALISNSFDESKCKLTISVNYDGACIPILPPLPENGLSVGSVLIIVFVVVVSTYFLCGCTFKFCYGFRGPEVLPHSEFWMDLPVLIVDGIVFTIKCGKTDMSRTYDGI